MLLGELTWRWPTARAFAVSPESELAAREAARRVRSSLLALNTGELLSEVHTLGPKDSFVVHDDTYSAQVRGTRFLVTRAAATSAPRCCEGRVEIMRGGAVGGAADNGQRWEARDVAQGPRGRQPHVYGVGALHDNWAMLTLPEHPRIAAWQLGDLRAWPPAGSLRMRAPAG